MEIQPFTQADIPLLTALQPDDWNNITPAFSEYTSSSFCHPVKIVMEHTIVGIGATIVHHEVAWLGHIIVHPAYRGKGIGQLVTQTLIDIANRFQCETIFLIATDLGAPVYEKAGFITDTEYLFFKDVHLEKDMQPSANIHQYEAAFKDQIAAIDSSTAAEDRLFRLKKYLDNALVYCKNNIVEGYYLPSWGEGLIIGTTPAAGIELLKLHLTCSDKIAFPKENTAALHFLRERGYTSFRSAKRMRLGKSRPVKLENIYNRIAGKIG